MSGIKTLNVHFTQEDYDFLLSAKPDGMTWRDFIIEIVKAYDKKKLNVAKDEKEE